ncbi:MAG: hypothetical protein AAFY74_16995 [Pseudomonadota bacterium]
MKAVLAMAMILSTSAALACDDRQGDRLGFADGEFKSASDVYYGEVPAALRVAAYFTMLRTNEPIFGTLIKEGKSDKNPDITATAIFCEMMRARGFTVKVMGLSEQAESLPENQKKQILSRSFPMKVISRHFDNACISTYSNKDDGCHPSYYVGFSNGMLIFRSEYTTGEFRWVDQEYVGTINLYVGGYYYPVPGTLIVQ